MDLLRSEILNITKSKPEMELRYYYNLLDIIDEHHDKKPDISIETCKAIIEGISKLIICKISQKPIAEVDKQKFKGLTNEAFDLLKLKSDIDNTEFVKKTVDLLKILNDTRNDHCDIGHGRVPDKEQINCSDFSEMISRFTESISVYLLKKLDKVLIAENAYDSEQMQEFNNWLDDNCKNFPIQTEKYSKILYKYDKDLYYTKYDNEFLADNELEEIISPKIKHITEKKESSIVDFESKYFTSEKQISLIKDFAKKENLNIEKLATLLDTYFFTNEIPPRNQLVDLLEEELSNEERKIKSVLLKEKITKLMETLTK